MPSKDFAARKYAALNQPNLSPNQTREIEQFYDHLERQEEGRHRLIASEDDAKADAQRQEHEERVRELVKGFAAKVTQAKARRLSAKEIGLLREELTAVVAYYDGDGEDHQGLISTLDAGYARTQAVLDDPGAAADAFYAKWPTLAGRRFVG